MLVLLLVSFIKPKLRDKEIIQNIYVILMYSIATIVAVIPIADEEHFLCGAMCTIILIIYLLYNAIMYAINKYVEDKAKYSIKTYLKEVTILLFVIYVVFSIIELYNYIEDVKDQNQINHFKYIQTSDETYERTKTVGEYILEKQEEGKTVYILDAVAAIYTIPIDVYNKDYDMFNLGNFGVKGVEGIIEDLNNTEDLLVLVRKEEYGKNWQHPDEVTDYVKENYELVDELYYFDVYEKE